MMQIILLILITVCVTAFVIYRIIKSIKRMSDEKCGRMSFEIAVLNKCLSNIANRENVDIEKYIQLTLEQMHNSEEEK